MPNRIKSDAPLASAKPGDEFVFTHPEEKGFGEHARPGEQTAEMRELDLSHGMVVRLLEFDADSGWPLIEWTDQKGINRITTIDPEYLGMFVPYER
jgi:hypothetical protein